MNPFKIKHLFITIILLGCWGSCFAQWTSLEPNSHYNLREVFFTNDSTGYIVGDRLILKTTDSGKNWAVVVSGFGMELDYKSVGIYFPSENVGYATAVGGEGVLKTINAGKNWTFYKTNNVGGAIHFINDNIGFSAAGDGYTISKTVDGGMNWKLHSHGVRNSSIEDIDFINDSTGFAIGWYAGKITKTTDVGNIWNNVTTDYSLLSFGFPSADTGYAVGHSISGSSGIIKTTDGGNTWKQLNSGINFSIRSVSCPTNEICYLVICGTGILKTSNGGNTLDTLTPYCTSYKQLHSVFCMDINTCYAVGDSGTILKIINGVNVEIFKNAFIDKRDTVEIVDTDTIEIIDNNSGIETDVFNENEIIIYPNPANETININIQTGKIAFFELYDIIGNKLIEQTLSTNITEINSEHITQGLYIYKITDNQEKTIRGKIIKQ